MDSIINNLLDLYCNLSNFDLFSASHSHQPGCSVQVILQQHFLWQQLRHHLANVAPHWSQFCRISPVTSTVKWTGGLLPKYTRTQTSIYTHTHTILNRFKKVQTIKSQTYVLKLGKELALNKTLLAMFRTKGGRKSHEFRGRKMKQGIGGGLGGVFLSANC